ncbi:MAG: hypothetical protein WB975_14910, partial [Nitrososphaeraceae archaeon]
MSTNRAIDTIATFESLVGIFHLPLFPFIVDVLGTRMSNKSCVYESLGIIFFAVLILVSYNTWTAQNAFALNSAEVISHVRNDCDSSSNCSHEVIQIPDNQGRSDGNSLVDKAVQTNGCVETSNCFNLNVQLAIISGDNNQFKMDSKQNNYCISAGCSNLDDQISNVIGNDNSVNDNDEQKNNCIGKGCSNSHQQIANLFSSGNDISRKNSQSNSCVDSQCVNGLTSFDSSKVLVNSKQVNDCVGGSLCSNVNVDFFRHLSSSQSNHCVNKSTCQNVGTNNDTTCVKEASCLIIGSNTRVISTGDVCNNSGDNTKPICSHGRIITHQLADVNTPPAGGGGGGVGGGGVGGGG